MSAIDTPPTQPLDDLETGNDFPFALLTGYLFGLFSAALFIALLLMFAGGSLCSQLASLPAPLHISSPAGSSPSYAPLTTSCKTAPSAACCCHAPASRPPPKPQPAADVAAPLT